MENSKDFTLIPTDRSNLNLSEMIHPVQASKALPDWYKDLAGYSNGTSHDIKNLLPNNDRGSDGSDVSTKLCLPFLDAMISGYMYLLEDDLTVDLDKNGKPELSWDKPTMIDIRPHVDMAIPEDCHPIQFGFKMSWYYRTPEKYSTLITHPMNRFDLPFYIPSGIVDSDIWGLPVFIPFFLKRNFVGTIKKGTPIFQMIPIKRDDWNLNIDFSEDSYMENLILEEKRRSHITAHYKKSTWQKKNY